MVQGHYHSNQLRTIRCMPFNTQSSNLCKATSNYMTDTLTSYYQCGHTVSE